MAGNVTAKLGFDGTSFSHGMEQARAKMKSLAGDSKETGREMHEAMTKGRESVALLSNELGVHLDRELRNFLSAMPGVTAAISGAFDAAAVVGVGLALAESVKRVVEFIEKAREMPEVIKNGFRQLNDSAQTANDSLRVTNDRLENEIAKLEGKPQNNLMLAIDEARLAADKFADALDRDNQKVKELLTQNKIGTWSALTSNQASTNTVAGTSEAYNQQIADLGARYALAKGGHADEEGKSPEELLKMITAKRAAGIAAMNEFIRQAKVAQEKPSFMNLAPILQGTNIAGPNQEGVISAAEGEKTTLLKQGDFQQQGARNAAGEKAFAKEKAIKDAEEAAKRAAAAAKAAQEAIVAQWHKDLDELRSTFDNILVQEGQFWVRRMESARKGSLSYIAALDEANKDIGRMHAENIRAQTEFDKTATIMPSSMDLSRGDTGTEKDQGRSATEFLKTLNDGISQRRADAEAIAEQSLQMQVLTGRMSKLGEAQALAALHAQTFADAQDRIAIALANANNLPEGLDKTTTIAGLQDRSEHVAAQAQMQAAQDQQKVANQQLGSASKDALRVMMQDWSSMTEQIVRTMTQAINSFNDDIVKAMTGHGKASDFGKTFSQASEGLMKASLQRLEAGVLGKTALGKPDGTQQNPIYTLHAGKAGGALGSQSPFFRPFFGGQQDQSGGGGGGEGFFKTLLGSIFGGQSGGGSSGGGDGFQGNYAGGGDVLANHPAMVGEAGPELFMPRTAGRIVPNNKLGGGDIHHHTTVNVTGNSDPAAVEAAVRRALPHAVSASMQAQHQAAKRSPHGR